MSLARKGNVTCMKRKLNAPCKKGKIFARKGNMKEKQSFLAKKEHAQTCTTFIASWLLYCWFLICTFLYIYYLD